MFEWRLNYQNKRPIIHFVKRKPERKKNDRNNKKQGQKKRKRSVYDKNNTHAAGKIDKLFEGEWPKNFVFNFYKLWNLKSHTVKH